MAGRLPAAADWVLRILVAACLVIDAIVHLRLAGGYQQMPHSGLGEGTIFRIEAVVALLIALWVLVRAGRAAYVVAALVGLSAVVAVVLYRYIDIGAFGPIPSMHEPIWFGQKVLSAVAEGLAAVLALVGVAMTSPARTTQHASR